MERKLLIGIDIGTSGCKTIVFDNGQVLRSATVSYPVSTPHPGWSEQNPEDWWSGVKQSLKTVMRDPVKQDPSKLLNTFFGLNRHQI